MMNEYKIQAKAYASYDVVVCGGGTAGCFAAIAAAREGARTLLIERTFTPGGMLTLGEAGITKFTEHCKDVDKYKTEVLDVLGTKPESVQVVRGLAREYCKRMIDNGLALGTHGEPGSYVFTDKEAAVATMMNMLDEAGVEVLYDTRVCLVNKEGSVIKSVIVVNKEGFSEIAADRFIDATGDGDVATLSGVPFNLGATEADLKEGCGRKLGEMMNFGTMYRVRGVNFERLFEYLKENPDKFHQHEFGVMSLDDVIESYNRGDMCVFRIKIGELSPTPHPNPVVQIYNLPSKDEAILLGPGCAFNNANGLDAKSLSRGQHSIKNGALALTKNLREFPGLENITATYIPDVGVRETRHIVGEYTVNGLDVVMGRKFEDAIACGGHPVDIHPIPPEIESMDMNHWRFYIPYRALVPKGVDNLLVAGRCVSATRLASGAIRPTAQCIAMGEAAGIASAMLVKSGGAGRDINVSELQEKLVEKGAII
ncbi:MAG: FAD-dependent oxidoreductase [Clostridia bacterium]|nr:FAD-dependent oxidoreductase [Clostridia bacterium]